MICSMQGIVVDAKETLVNKMDKVPNPVEFLFE